MGAEESLLIKRPDQYIKKHLNKNLFDFLYIIGRGGFSKVWKVAYKKTGHIYALKEMSKVKIIDRKSEKNIISERDFLTEIRSPFIVNILCSFQDKDNLYLLMDYYPGGDLRYHLMKKQKFNESQTKFIAACILTGLSSIHSKNIIHRDLKPENIMCDSNGYVAITDFGIAKKCLCDNSNDTSGTPGYMAPEVLFGKNHSFPADFYALGIMCFEFIMGYRPYSGISRKKVKEQIISKQVRINKNKRPKGCSIEAVNFINSLIQRKPERRLGYLGILEVKQHEWFQEFYWEELENKSLISPIIINNRDNYDKSYCEKSEIDGNDTVGRYIDIKTKSKYKYLFANYTFVYSELDEVKKIYSKGTDDYGNYEINSEEYKQKYKEKFMDSISERKNKYKIEDRGRNKSARVSNMNTNSNINKKYYDFITKRFDDNLISNEDKEEDSIDNEKQNMLCNNLKLNMNINELNKIYQENYSGTNLNNYYKIPSDYKERMSQFLKNRNMNRVKYKKNNINLCYNNIKVKNFQIEETSKNNILTININEKEKNKSLSGSKIECNGKICKLSKDNKKQDVEIKKENDSKIHNNMDIYEINKECNKENKISVQENKIQEKNDKSVKEDYKTNEENTNNYGNIIENNKFAEDKQNLENDKESQPKENINIKLDFKKNNNNFIYIKKPVTRNKRPFSKSISLKAINLSKDISLNSNKNFYKIKNFTINKDQVDTNPNVPSLTNTINQNIKSHSQSQSRKLTTVYYKPHISSNLNNSKLKEDDTNKKLGKINSYTINYLEMCNSLIEKKFEENKNKLLNKTGSMYFGLSKKSKPKLIFSREQNNLYLANKPVKKKLRLTPKNVDSGFRKNIFKNNYVCYYNNNMGERMEKENNKANGFKISQVFNHYSNLLYSSSVNGLIGNRSISKERTCRNTFLEKIKAK